MKLRILERLKKFCGHAERGFLGIGEALAKAQVRSNPVTEPKRSQKPKGPLSITVFPRRCSIFDNALIFLALGGLLAGCASEPPITTYHAPLISPGGKFSTLPPAVQNSVRAQVGTAEIDTISKESSGDSRIYVFHFRNTAVFPPLYVASDGSVLTSDLQVAVGATQDTIEASTAHVSNGVKFDTLPVNVVNTIRSHAPTGEVDSVQRITAGSDTFYDVFFKDPWHNPRLLISEDGRVVR